MAKALEGVPSHEEAVVLPVVPNSQDMAVLGAVIERRLILACELASRP